MMIKFLLFTNMTAITNGRTTFIIKNIPKKLKLLCFKIIEVQKCVKNSLELYCDI